MHDPPRTEHPALVLPAIELRRAAVLRRFGDTLVPREGKALGVLSTGYPGQFDEIDDGGAHDSGPAFASSTALGTTGILLSGSPEEGQLIGKVKAAPASPGRAQIVSRDRGLVAAQLAFVRSKFDA